MTIFINPDGQSEDWDVKPVGYFTPEEWNAEPFATERQRKSLLSQLTNLDAQYLTQRILAGAATGDEYALGKVAEHESLAAPLREQLAGFAAPVS